MRKILLSTVAVASVSALAAPAAAPATGWNCSASAVVGQPAGAPVTANVGALACKAATAGLDLPALPLPLTANVLSARTGLDGPSGTPAQQTASATGEVLNLGLGVPTGLPIQVPTTAVPNPLGGAPVDITSALRTLVPVASGQLLGIQSASATASGQCAGGRPRLTGSSRALARRCSARSCQSTRSSNAPSPSPAAGRSTPRV